MRGPDEGKITATAAAAAALAEATKRPSRKPTTGQPHLHVHPSRDRPPLPLSHTPSYIPTRPGPPPDPELGFLDDAGIKVTVTMWLRL